MGLAPRNMQAKTSSTALALAVPSGWCMPAHGCGGCFNPAVTTGIDVASAVLGLRECWRTIRQTPIVYRYIDWSSTMPLQLTVFFRILKAAKPDLGAGLFWRWLLGTGSCLLSATSVSSAWSTHRLVCNWYGRMRLHLVHRSLPERWTGCRRR